MSLQRHIEMLREYAEEKDSPRIAVIAGEMAEEKTALTADVLAEAISLMQGQVNAAQAMLGDAVKERDTFWQMRESMLLGELERTRAALSAANATIRTMALAAMGEEEDSA